MRGLRLRELEWQIETSRKQLYELIGCGQSLISTETVNMSQKLDQLLNQYNALKCQMN